MSAEGDSVQRLHRLIQENESDYLERLKQVQNELNKQRHKQAGSAASKAQQKKSEKLTLQAWTNTHMPADSLQLFNAVMYLENVLVAIANEVQNERNYTLLYKFLARAHVL